MNLLDRIRIVAEDAEVKHCDRRAWDEILPAAGSKCHGCGWRKICALRYSEV